MLLSRLSLHSPRSHLKITPESQKHYLNCEDISRNNVLQETEIPCPLQLFDTPLSAFSSSNFRFSFSCLLAYLLFPYEPHYFLQAAAVSRPFLILNIE